MKNLAASASIATLLAVSSLLGAPVRAEGPMGSFPMNLDLKEAHKPLPPAPAPRAAMEGTLGAESIHRLEAEFNRLHRTFYQEDLAGQWILTSEVDVQERSFRINPKGIAAEGCGGPQGILFRPFDLYLVATICWDLNNGTGDVYTDGVQLSTDSAPDTASFGYDTYGLSADPSDKAPARLHTTPIASVDAQCRMSDKDNLICRVDSTVSGVSAGKEQSTVYRDYIGFTRKK